MYPIFGFELFEITPVGLLALVGWAVAAFFIGKQLFKDDRELRALQRWMDDLSAELAKLGFQLLPPILRDVAFLDIIQTKADIKHAIDVLKDPAKRRLDFAQLLEGLLKDEAKNTETNQGFLNNVVAMFKSHGVVPTSGPATDAVGNVVNPDSYSDNTSSFQANKPSATMPAPVVVNVHTNGSPAVSTDAAAAPASAKATA